MRARNTTSSLARAETLLYHWKLCVLSSGGELEMQNLARPLCRTRVRGNFPCRITREREKDDCFALSLAPSSPSSCASAHQPRGSRIARRNYRRAIDLIYIKDDLDGNNASFEEVVFYCRAQSRQSRRAVGFLYARGGAHAHSNVCICVCR